MELNIPAIEGIGGSLLYLVDRYGDAVDLRRRFRRAGQGQRRGRAGGLTCIDHLTHNVHARAHGPLGRLLRAALQFPRDPLLRHRGQADRAVLARADQPLRQDPHSDQRESQDDKSQIEEFLQGLPRRGHPAYRAGDRRHLPHGRRARAPGRRIPGHARHLLRGRRTRASPGTARGSEELQAAAYPDRRLRARARASCCRSSRRTSSARSSSRSSSARATRASARAISRRCSSPSSSIRCAAASSRRDARARDTPGFASRSGGLPRARTRSLGARPDRALPGALRRSRRV